jgi:molybdopterin synthase catalytic subunit
MDREPLNADRIALEAVPLDAGEALAFVCAPDAGGVNVFLGTTRAESRPDGSRLTALDYEAYAEMAEQQMQDLACRARQRWPIVRLALLHRVGLVPLGQPSVLIAASAPHRAEAFEACRWLIDTLKTEVTIWKKEIWDDGLGNEVGVWKDGTRPSSHGAPRG